MDDLGPYFNLAREEKLKSLKKYKQWIISLYHGDLAFLAELFDESNAKLREVFIEVYGADLTAMFSGEWNLTGLVMEQNLSQKGCPDGSYKIGRHESYDKISDTHARTNSDWKRVREVGIKLLKAGIREPGINSKTKAYSLVSEEYEISDRTVVRYWQEYQKQEDLFLKVYDELLSDGEELEQYLMSRL